MKKIMIVLIVSTLLVILLVITSCKVEETSIQTEFVDINESFLEDKSCVTDDDCLVTDYRPLQCCVTCVVDPINTKAANERERWRDNNCKNYTTEIQKYSNPSYPEELIPDKWSDCLEYAECSALTQHYNVFCINNICQEVEK